MSVCKKRLVNIEDINEELFLLCEYSNYDYITRTGRVYLKINDDEFYQRKIFTNKSCGYNYVALRFKNGTNKNRRLHILLAKTFIKNPDPIKNKIVGHKNNIKTDNRLENLYWTTNQENTQKAVDDGLNKFKKAEENDFSFPVKVIDKNTLAIVGVYGSIRECCRCITNISPSFIIKVYEKEDYKPRSKRYIYQKSNIEEFNSYPELQNIKLQENDKVNKKPKVFLLKNVCTGFEQIMDNQKEAEKITGIKQSQISSYIKKNDNEIHDGWIFNKIGEKEYTESSSYENLLNNINDVSIQNIHTQEVKTFKTIKLLKDYLGLKGHDIRQYIKTNQTLMSEWKVVDLM